MGRDPLAASGCAAQVDDPAGPPRSAAHPRLQADYVRLAAIAISVAAMTFAAAAVVQANEVKHRIAWGSFPPWTVVQDSAEAFREGLRALGHHEGSDIVIEQRSAEGRDDRVALIADELIAGKPDVILTAGSRMVRVLKEKTDTIPIVVAVMSDPIGAGFIASYARPGGNVTGLAFQDAELVTKRVELLKELVPGLRRVALFYDPAGPAGGPGTVIEAAKHAVHALSLELRVIEVGNAAGIAAAFEAARAQSSQAVLQVASPLFSAHRQLLVDEAARTGLPLVCEQAGFVVIGCLVSYGPNFADMYRRAAEYVDRILKGSTAAELPVQQPAKFELFINRRTARALGLELPPSLIARADEVIE
jgi:putative tryptophan/tyrosine transport system substrate-binding protein